MRFLNLRLMGIWVTKLLLPSILFVGSNEGPHRFSNLNLEEKRTQVYIKGITELLSDILVYLFLCVFMNCNRL